MTNQLAIVIPAYKATFLSVALESIAAQTCKDFTLYIGDDSSPNQLEDIVNQYKNKVNLVYKRFESNLGGTDLVAQWERCIAMTQGEPYIWLFSDDDVMEPRCVEVFYKHLELTEEKYDLYHFNVRIINDKGEVTRTHQSYPQALQNFEYYKGKMKAKYVSLVVENIFSRSVYERHGGFKNFDLAWGSDTATWVLFSERTGFYTMDGAYVQWRSSDENITPNNSSSIVVRKVNALLDFFEWSYHYYSQRGHDCRLVNVRAFINRMSKFCNYITDAQFKETTKKFCKVHEISVMAPLLYMLIKHRKKKV